MWMGDYPVLPAKSLKTGIELYKIVDDNKEKLREKLRNILDRKSTTTANPSGIRSRGQTA